MSKVDDQITELKAEVARLHARLDELTKPAPAPPPKPKAVVEDGVCITYPAMHNPGFVMPSAVQLDQLLEIACRTYPILKAGIKPGRFAAQDEADFRNEFEAAFRALGSIGRMPAGEVDEKHCADRWIRVVQGRLQGGSQAMHLLPLTAAVICHGDIAFMLCPADMMSSSFGLRADDVGVAATDRWRHALATGVARESLPLPRNRQWSAGLQVNGAR